MNSLTIIRTTPELAHTAETATAKISFYEAQKVTDGIRQLVADVNNQFLEIGKALSAAYDDGVHTALSMSFPEWVEQSFGIKRSTAYAMVQVSRFVEQFPEHRERVLRIGTSKAELLVAHAGWNVKDRQFVKPPEQIDELLNSAETLTVRDFKRLAQNLPDETPTDNAYLVCPCGCNRTIKVVLQRGSKVVSYELVKPLGASEIFETDPREVVNG